MDNGPSVLHALPLGAAHNPLAAEAPGSAPVVIQVAESVSGLRLSVTEDQFSYDIVAEFDDIPAGAFEVELAGNKVYILVRDEAALMLACDAAEGCLAVHDERKPGQVALAFGNQIEALRSWGECCDGLLHLTLGKQVPLLELGEYIAAQ